MISTAIRLLPLALLVLLPPEPGYAQRSPAPAEPARVYLDSALVIMRANVLGGDTVDWVAFRAELFRRAAGAEIPVDTYAAIRWALRALNPHSFLQISEELEASERARRPPSEQDAAKTSSEREVYSPFSGRRRPEGELHDFAGRRVGRIVVPAFGGRHVSAFADGIADGVRSMDSAGACGWIVDLRGNGGGNMWPMLAGLGALLEDGQVGEFHGPMGVTGTWFERNGAAGIVQPDGEVIEIARIGGEPYRLAGLAPVAVLFDRGTGSSGEAVAIAFIGRPRTRSFGVPSYGYTTANDGFRLPDSANIVLTVGVGADRNGRPYPTALIPDERVPIVPGDSVPASPPREDPQLRAALEWVVRQEGCAPGN